MNNGIQNAFPNTRVTTFESGGTETYQGGGLTKREYLAAMAMASMASTWEPEDSELRYYPDKVARMSIKYADALLKELEKT